MTRDISVVICAYTEKRWNDLVEVVSALHLQTLPPREIIVVIDYNPALLERVQAEIMDVMALENTGERGLSGARNTGIAATHGEILAFIDEDAVPEHDWLERLAAG